MDLAAAREAGVSAVRAACAVTEHVRAEIAAADQQTKGDKSPVTVGDFAAQAILVTMLSRTFPGVPVVAEESADKLRREAGADLRDRVVRAVRSCAGLGQLSADDILDAIDVGAASPPTGSDSHRYFWCIDPIDGTKGFLRNEQYAVCLGLVHLAPDNRGTAVLGILGCPNLPLAPVAAALSAPEHERGAILHAVLDGGAVAESLADPARRCPVRVQQGEGEGSGLCCVESVEAAHTDQATNLQLCTRVGITEPPVRMDSQCKYTAVAWGAASLYLRMADYSQNIWDHAAGAAIVAEAGGCVTDAHGVPLDFGAGRQLSRNACSLVASCDLDGHLHAKTIHAIASLAADRSPPATATAAGGDGWAGFAVERLSTGDEAAVLGAAAVLELSSFEFEFPTAATAAPAAPPPAKRRRTPQSWQRRISSSAAGVRSYLPSSAVLAERRVTHTHGPGTAAQRARSAFWVLWDRRSGWDAVVGTIAVHPGKGQADHAAGGPDDPACAVLARFSLSPAVRGKGLGQRLYEVAEEFCRADTAGYDKIWLETSRRQVAARKLYIRNGYVYTAAASR